MKMLAKYLLLFCVSGSLISLPNLASADPGPGPNWASAITYLQGIYTAMTTTPAGGASAAAPLYSVIQIALDNEYQTHYLVAAPDIGAIASVNSNIPVNEKNVKHLADFINNITLGTVLSNAPNIGDDPSQLFATRTNNMAMMQGTDLPTSGNNPNTMSNAAFDFDSLLGTVAYSGSNYSPSKKNVNTLSTAQTNAINFIKFLSNTANPYPAVNYSQWLNGSVKDNNNNPITTLPALMNQFPAVKTLRLATLNWASFKSIALSTLYRAYAERVKIAGAGHNASLPNSTHASDANYDASALQIDEYNATRRLNQNWYNQMSTVDPSVVERETLFVLAEIRNEEYERRLQQERTNVMLAAILLQVANQAESNSLSQLQGQANTAINPVPASAAQYLPPKAQSSTPGSNTPPPPPTTQPTYQPPASNNSSGSSSSGSSN